MIRRLRSFADCSLAAVEGDRPVVFHHLPKTAGSTFRTILESYFPPGQVCPHETEASVLALDPARRAAYRLFAGHYSFPFVADRFPDAVRLVFLRHPVARVISQYYNLHDAQRVPEHWRQHAESAPREYKDFLEWITRSSLEEFVFSDDPYARGHSQNYQTVFLTRRSVPPFFELPRDNAPYDPALLEEAKANLEREFAFVGVQEDFPLSMRLFCATFGLPPLGDVRGMSRNVNPRKAGRRAYAAPPRVMERILAGNRMDLELWAHARALVQERVAVLADHWARAFPGAMPRRAASPAGEVFLSLDDCAATRGFYWRETDGRGRPFAWSGYEQPAVLEFELPLRPGAEVDFAIHVLAVFAGVSLEDMRVSFDGRPAAVSVSRTAAETVVRCRATAGEFPRAVHVVKFVTAAGSEFGGGEGRELGIAVRGLSLDRGAVDA